MARAWQEHGKNDTARPWQEHGKCMPMTGAWQGHDKSMARAWREHGNDKSKEAGNRHKRRIRKQARGRGTTEGAGTNTTNTNKNTSSRPKNKGVYKTRSKPKTHNTVCLVLFVCFRFPRFVLALLFFTGPLLRHGNSMVISWQ